MEVQKHERFVFGSKGSDQSYLREELGLVKAAIDVSSEEIGSEVASYHTVYIDHRDDLERHFLS